MNRLTRKDIIVAAIITSALVLVFPEVAQASIDVEGLPLTDHRHYLDPGTGSLIIQMIVGSLLAGLAMIGVYRRRVGNRLRKLFRTQRDDEGSE